MDKVKGIAIIIVAVFSVILTILIANVLLDTTGKVNQGNFRISDVAVESSALVEEVQGKDVAVKSMSDYLFDLSQKNEISILLEANVEASSISIENLTVSEPTLKGQFIIYTNEKNKEVITPELKHVEVDPGELKDGKYVLTINIDNDEVLTKQRVPESTEKIQYDAVLFKTLGINTDELKFTVAFDLVVTDVTGTTTRTTINLVMPTDETYTQGMSILRQDASKFIFTIEK